MKITKILSICALTTLPPLSCSQAMQRSIGGEEDNNSLQTYKTYSSPKTYYSYKDQEKIFQQQQESLEESLLTQMILAEQKEEQNQRLLAEKEKEIQRLLKENAQFKSHFLSQNSQPTQDSLESPSGGSNTPLSNKDSLQLLPNSSPEMERDLLSKTLSPTTSSGKIIYPSLPLGGDYESNFTQWKKQHGCPVGQDGKAFLEMLSQELVGTSRILPPQDFDPLGKNIQDLWKILVQVTENLGFSKAKNFSIRDLIYNLTAFFSESDLITILDKNTKDPEKCFPIYWSKRVKGLLQIPSNVKDYQAAKDFLGCKAGTVTLTLDALNEKVGKVTGNLRADLMILEEALGGLYTRWSASSLEKKDIENKGFYPSFMRCAEGLLRISQESLYKESDRWKEKAKEKEFKKSRLDYYEAREREKHTKVKEFVENICATYKDLDFLERSLKKGQDLLKIEAFLKKENLSISEFDIYTSLSNTLKLDKHVKLISSFMKEFPFSNALSSNPTLALYK